MNNMRIFLFVGTIDALMSIIGYIIAIICPSAAH